MQSYRENIYPICKRMRAIRLNTELCYLNKRNISSITRSVKYENNRIYRVDRLGNNRCQSKSVLQTTGKRTAKKQQVCWLECDKGRCYLKGNFFLIVNSHSNCFFKICKAETLILFTLNLLPMFLFS